MKVLGPNGQTRTNEFGTTPPQTVCTSAPRRDSLRQPRARKERRGEQATTRSDCQQRRSERCRRTNWPRGHHNRASDLEHFARLPVSSAAPCKLDWTGARLKGSSRASSVNFSGATRILDWGSPSRFDG